MTPPALSTDTRAVIGVATDFSEGAALAVQRAIRLAREHGLPVRVVHVLAQDWLTTLQTWLGDAALPERIEADTEAALQAVAATVAAESGQPAPAVLERGHPVRTLAEWAERHALRWLVLGAHGRGAWQRLLLGTTAERLLRKLTRPMLVVRQPTHGPYRRVLLPVDFSPWSAPTLALVEALAPQAEVELMHVYTVPFEEKLRFAGVEDDVIARLRERVRADAHSRLLALAQQRGWSPSRYRIRLHEGDAAPGIVGQAQHLDCDLIAIGKHGQGAAEELLLGSVTKHVVAEAGCDVLVSPAHGADAISAPAPAAPPDPQRPAPPPG